LKFNSLTGSRASTSVAARYKGGFLFSTLVGEGEFPSLDKALKAPFMIDGLPIIEGEALLSAMDELVPALGAALSLS
jgi:hypothetical protein